MHPTQRRQLLTSVHHLYEHRDLLTPSIRPLLPLDMEAITSLSTAS